MISSPANSDKNSVRQIALNYYGLEPKIELISNRNNQVFRLSFPDSCKILKLAKQSNNRSIGKELMLLELLRQHEIPTVTIEQRDTEGTIIGKPFFIMDSAGEQNVAIWINKPGSVAQQLFFQMGSLLAQIHGIHWEKSGDIQPDGIIPIDRQTYLQHLYRKVESLAQHYLLNAKEVELFQSLKMPSWDGRSLCHRDFHGVQCIVKEEKITAVVDWESAWSSNPLIDLAITNSYLDYYCPSNLIRCFFSGYKSVRSIPEDYAREYLPVRMAHMLALLGVWYRHGHQPNIDRALLLYRTYCQSYLQ